VGSGERWRCKKLEGLRILYASRFPPAHCGVGEYTRMLVEAIKSISRNTKVYVVATEKSSREPYDWNGVTTVYPVMREDTCDYSGILDVLTEVGGVDILHVEHEYGIFRNSLNLLSVLSEAKRERLAVKNVVTLHTVYHPNSGRRDALLFQKMLATDIVDAIIVHSWVQEFELIAQGVPPGKIQRIPHGTLINPYISAPRTKLLKSLGISPEMVKGFILITPGFIREDKGLDVLMEALKGIDMKYTFIAAGEAKSPKVTGLLEENPNTIIIDRYLSHDEILRLIAISDAIILPYKDKPGTYSVSGILHLSMGSLRPIIGTKTPRLIELYAKAPQMTVPPQDPHALQSKIIQVYRNYELVVPYMSELYAYAARTQWPRIAQRHLKLYRQALTGEVWEAYEAIPSEW
jgi:glycosyltransferase involved in cell wall biosynthesis